ncbi:hypothetical protein [Myxococcus xanthus]|uniref:Uncharacterized protein n=1 Tax=Myxococcus xanthus TaxID=34 RepID=A0A7Y4ILR0_MYXXA|nr:hypothetical protein [Myxococcus xanthus]NOJ81587.1 hypothetical protein [Myxococcus xanthus]NOJ89057.1 hypothetical protein [Myxococcus xanthus]
MANMWEQTEELAKRHEQAGGAWLKLVNDGDTAVVVFLGEPHPREVVFHEGKYVLYDEKLRAQGHKPSLRVALNVALFDTREVKVLEMGVAVFKDVRQLRAKYGLEKWAFEVKRRGAAKDPKTTYSLLPERQLTPEESSAFHALRLHNLAKLYAAEAEEDGAPPTTESPRAAPVDVAAAQALAAQLKSLPREAVDRFLQHFGVQRIRDVPATRGEEAHAFVQSLVARYAPPEASADVDPFAG